MNKGAFLKDAAVISAGGFVAKAMGAAYRIPLTALIGSIGLGVYQMVYPLYAIMLTLTSSALPSALSRLISSGRHPRAHVAALRLYVPLSVAGWLIMSALAPLLAAAQGRPEVEACCRLLAPSLVPVALISAVRGWFQGRGDMAPTFFTEVCEQAVKVGAGILMCSIFRGDAARGVAAAVGAVTLSEAVAAVYAWALYAGAPKPRLPLYDVGGGYGDILKYTLPLTLTAAAVPLSQFAESVALPALLRAAEGSAASLWGIFSGCALTLVNLPVSLCYGFAAAGIPSIAPLAEGGAHGGARRAAVRAVGATLALSLPCAAALFALCPAAADILFPSLGAGERGLLVTLVRVMSVNAVTLSLVQTSSACLTALGLPLRATAVQWGTSLARVALSVCLVAFTRLGIIGAALSANVCYLVAVLLDFWYIIRRRSEHGPVRMLAKRARTGA